MTNKEIRFSASEATQTLRDEALAVNKKQLSIIRELEMGHCDPQAEIDLRRSLSFYEGVSQAYRFCVDLLESDFNIRSPFCRHFNLAEYYERHREKREEK